MTLKKKTLKAKYLAYKPHQGAIELAYLLAKQQAKGEYYLAGKLVAA